MTVRQLSCLLLIIGCTGTPATVLSDRDRLANPELTGAWDLTLTLERPYPLGLSSPPARRVCGTIGFVDAGETRNSAIARESAGVYHVALDQLGLDWLDDTRFPSAIARQPEFGDGEPTSNDSVAITLNPGSKERIELLGVYRGSQIGGNWNAQSARGTASGIFILRPHMAGAARRAAC